MIILAKVIVVKKLPLMTIIEKNILNTTFPNHGCPKQLATQS
jgi:hypothetical protein